MGKGYDYVKGGKLIRGAESTITLSGEIVTAKNLVSSILYSYDSEGKLIRKRILPVGGSEQVIHYENPENENAVVKFKAGGRTITSHSKTDSFGRKVFDELQLGTGFVSRQFHYHPGEVTQEHKDVEKLKSSPLTQLVSQIVLSGGRTISYEYDVEERITKVTDSVDDVTDVYGDSTWKDLLTSYSRSWSWSQKQIRSFATALSEAIKVAKAVSRIITAVKAIKKTRFDFYIISYYGALPIIGRRINRDQAVSRAKRGGNSITYHKANALWVANVAGNAYASRSTWWSRLF